MRFQHFDEWVQFGVVIVHELLDFPRILEFLYQQIDRSSESDILEEHIRLSLFVREGFSGSAGQFGQRQSGVGKWQIGMATCPRW